MSFKLPLKTTLIWVGVAIILSPTKVSPEWTISASHYVFHLLRSMHACDLELILIAPEDLGPEGCLCYLRTFDIAFIPTRTFLLSNLTHIIAADNDHHHRPKCLAFLPHPHANFSSIIVKMNSAFGGPETQKFKPNLLYIYPHLLPRQNLTEQHLYMKSLYNSTSNFFLNSDVYTIFASSSGENNTVIKASIWETYSIKRMLFLRPLPLPISFAKLQDDDQIEEIYVHYLDQIGNKVGRRNNFMGLTLVASAKYDQEYSGWAKIERVDGKLTLVGGSSAVWYWDLAMMLNFSIEIVYGDSIITLRNNSLAGKTLEQLNSGVSDLTLMTALVVDFRAKSLTFLQPFYSTLIHVFFSQPSANSIRNIVTAPFHILLWLTIIFTWILLILIVKFGRWLQLHFNSDFEGTMGRSKDTEFGSTIGLWAIAANCQKSWYAVPGSLALKLAFICGSLCGVMVYGAYSAAIVSTLAVHSVPVEQFVDLITYNFAFTVHNRSEPFQLILKHLIHLWKLPQEVMRVETEEEISHLLEDSGHPKAFLSYQDLFYQTALSLGYSERFICNALSKVQVSEFRYKTAMFLKKGSEYAETFNHKILVIRERGFNFRYVQHYEAGNVFGCVKGSERTKDVEPLGFSDAFTAFLVIFIGYLLSLVLLIQERLYRRFLYGRKHDGNKGKTDHEKRYSLTTTQ